MQSLICSIFAVIFSKFPSFSSIFHQIHLSILFSTYQKGAKRMRQNVLQLPFRTFFFQSSSSGKAVKLAYNTASPRDGDSGKTPLLIYHGLFGSKVNWKSLSSQFASLTKRQVYAFDLRNHGDSPHTSGEDATLQCMAKDIELFMDENRLDKAALLGHR